MLLSPIIIVLFFLSFSLLPSTIFAKDLDLTSSIDELSTTFSNKFCVEIAEGINPENAGEIAAKEMVKGLIFSPVLKEVMAIPKEVLASSLSRNIYSGCGDQLEISEQELNDYLVKLADRDREQSDPKPFKPFGIG